MTDEPDSPPPFVTLRARHDGWTQDKQAQFLEALAETACVEEACRRVGLTRQSAYRLRRQERAIAFRQAWNAAIDHAMHQLEEAALSRAINGVPRPIFYHGEQICEWREYDERLAMFLLRYRRPQRFGGWIDQAPCDPEDEPAGRLEYYLEELDELPPEGADLAEAQGQ